MECLLREAVRHYRKMWLAVGAENTSFSLTGNMQRHLGVWSAEEELVSIDRTGLSTERK